MIDKTMIINNELPIEDDHLEYKKSAKSLSDDMWETFCAFENSSGGDIVLGVSEKNNTFFVSGIKNSYSHKILDEFYSTLSNRASNKISYYDEKIEKNVEKVSIEDDKLVIIIHVPEAPRKFKPVYSNQHAYIRNGSTDKLASNSEIKRLDRDAIRELDTKVFINMDKSDLNMSDIEFYKNTLQENEKYKRRYGKLNIDQFLEAIGVTGKDKEGKKGITAGGLLFFGKYNNIIMEFPNFQLDYFDKSDRTAKRWSNRITTVFDDYNIYSFYREIIEELYHTVNNGFKLNDMGYRIDVGSLLREAIREGTVNMLMHADYFDAGGLKIDVMPEYYTFENPGRMLITEKEFFNTSKTCVRNPIISKLFTRIGIGERAGTGGETIKSNSLSAGYCEPSIETTKERTALKIWRVDYVQSLSEKDFNPKEKSILSAISKNKKIFSSHRDIERITGYSRPTVSKYLNKLMEKKIVVKKGRGRATRYSLPITANRVIAQIENVEKIMKKFYSAEK